MGLLLICWCSYSHPTPGVSPDELNLGQVKPNTSSVNPFCLKAVIQTKTRWRVTPIILLPLYLQSKPIQNCKNLWNWTKLHFFDSYKYNLIQAYRSVYQKEDFQSVEHYKDHSRSAHWQRTQLFLSICRKGDHRTRDQLWFSVDTSRRVLYWWGKGEWANECSCLSLPLQQQPEVQEGLVHGGFWRSAGDAPKAMFMCCGWPQSVPGSSGARGKERQHITRGEMMCKHCLQSIIT